MTGLKNKIQESAESKAARKSELFKDGIIKSLDFPIEDSEGYTIGTFTGFEPIEPTGEVRQTRSGLIANNRMQLRFTFKVPTENGYLNLNFWTGTSVDGIRDEKGRLNKLTTFFVAIGALDEDDLHPKFKVDEKSLMLVVKDIYQKSFRFKTEMKGRIHVPIIESFELILDSETTEA